VRSEDLAENIPGGLLLEVQCPSNILSILRNQGGGKKHWYIFPLGEKSKKRKKRGGVRIP